MEERLAKRLLQARDRAGSDDLPLTQEFLAQMLGVRRASVTTVAGGMQSAGLIKYRRGHIRIEDSEELLLQACECHGVVSREYDRLLAPPDA